MDFDYAKTVDSTSVEIIDSTSVGGGDTGFLGEETSRDGDMEGEHRAESATPGAAMRRGSDADFVYRTNEQPAHVLRSQDEDRRMTLEDMIQIEEKRGVSYERSSYQFWHNTLVELGYGKLGHSLMEHAAMPIKTEDSRHRFSSSRSQSKSYIKSASRLLRAVSKLSDRPSGTPNLDRGASADSMVMFQFFDLTPVRIRELFQHWDVDNSGTIVYDELLKGLRAQKLDLPINESTKKKIRAIFGCKSKEKKLEITISEFSTFLHRTKLAMLFYEPLRRGIYKKIKGHEAFLQPATGTSENEANQYCPTAEMLIIDYNKNDLEIQCANPESDGEPLPFTLDNKEAQKYFFGSRKLQAASMRWISVEKPDPVSILTLAVKYRLHPLALEDMLSLSGQPPKIDKYGNHYFLILPVFRLTANAHKVMRNFDLGDENFCDQWKNVALIEKQNYALCVAGINPLFLASSYDTVISVEGGFAPFSWKTSESLIGGPHDAPRHHSSDVNDAAGAESKSHDKGSTSIGHGVFRKALFRQLGTDFSRIRMKKSIFMMYSLIDAAVNQLGPVIAMFRMRLDWYTEQIRNQRWRFGNRIRSLLDTKREIEKLQEQIRPCISVIRHIINDEGLAPTREVATAILRSTHGKKLNRREKPNDASAAAPQEHRPPLWDESLQKKHIENDPVEDLSRQTHLYSVDGNDNFFGLQEIKQYFEDIDDSLNLHLEALHQMADLCASYTLEFESYGDRRMNDILFVLAIVTTLPLPAQFLTGVFGMNFVKPDGTPNMPLLTWEHGYTFFWILSSFLTVLVFLALFVQGWLPCSRCNRCAESVMVAEAD